MIDMKPSKMAVMMGLRREWRDSHVTNRKYETGLDRSYRVNHTNPPRRNWRPVDQKSACDFKAASI